MRVSVGDGGRKETKENREEEEEVWLKLNLERVILCWLMANQLYFLWIIESFIHCPSPVTEMLTK